MLAPDQVAVFFAEPAALLESIGAGAIEDVLDPADCAHVARFRFAADRTAAAASRLLQRLVVAWAADVEPAALRFERSSTGRPLVAVPDAARGIRFSASNTRDLVGCAVARHREVGIDVEAVRPEAPDELLGECLNALERRAIESLPVACRGERFVVLWTLKEAYLKALGIGLTVALQEIAFDPDSHAKRPVLRCDRVTGSQADAWAFHSLRPSASHIAAVCSPAGHRLDAWWASCSPCAAELRFDRGAA